MGFASQTTTAGETDTITAVATAGGKGALGVVRVSGPKVEVIAEQVLGYLPPPRQATYAAFVGFKGELLDKGLALYFPAPHSYTGESVLELQGHGSQILLGGLVDHLIALGARLARPGEFSERAFLNNKIDLVQAEAVADLINSTSQAAVRAALQSLSGEFSKRIDHINNALLHLRIHLEASLDFPDEEINTAVHSHQVKMLEQDLATLIKSAEQGRMLCDGVRVALVGAPNTGKSSLMNYFTQQDTSIVTPVPGTTRDVVRVITHLKGLTLHLADTAGLHQRAQDEVEAIGMTRAVAECQAADLVILLSAEGVAPMDEPLLLQPHQLLLRAHNKIDLSQRQAGIDSDGRYCISIHTQQGLSLLCEGVLSTVGFRAVAGDFTARQRHLVALKKALGMVRQAWHCAHAAEPPELLAEHLRAAHSALGSITGAITTEGLLAEIFSSFCIGK